MIIIVMIIKRVRNTTVIRTMSTVMMTSITAATCMNLQQDVQYQSGKDFAIELNALVCLAHQILGIYGPRSMAACCPKWYPTDISSNIPN